MPTSRQDMSISRIDRKPLIVAFIPTVLTALVLLAAYLDAAFEMQSFLFSIAAISIFGLLFRLYRTTKRPKYSEKLKHVRIHILLHCIPFIFLSTNLFAVTSPWINPVLISLFVVFFASGRVTWKGLEALFPSTKLYHFFYRGNSAFMTSLPALYVASFIIPDVVTFNVIRTVALFYFSVHFMIFGLASLKLQSDIQSEA